ncbi:MAG: outer membrane beta-barrel family protein [Chryseolinea sp.]
MEKAIAIVLGIISYTSAYNQTIESVKGRVINAEGRPQFGNAIIMSSPDSTVLKGTSFIEGAFEVSGLDAQHLLLKLTSLEFKDTLFTVRFEGASQIDLGDIVVREAYSQLDEVTVTGTTPLVTEMADGSIKVRVANTTLATSTSLNEILSKAPGLILNEDNEVSVFGKGVGILFINGIRVTNDRLSTLSPSDIESIEIITNPGSRYDAEGNAVINVITKQDAVQASNGLVKNYFSYAPFGGPEDRTDVNYHYAKGKWVFNSNYAFLTGKSRHLLETIRTRENENDYFLSHLITDFRHEFDNYSNYGIGGQYNLNKDQYLSLQYSGGYEALGGKQVSQNHITFDEEGIYESNVQYDEKTLQDNISANYYAKLDSAGSNLFIGMQYASYLNEFDNDIIQVSTTNNGQTVELIQNEGANDIQIASLQGDYANVFGKNGILELGIKFSQANIKSNTVFFDVVDEGQKTIDDALSNNFDYEERIPAAYVNLKGKINGAVDYSVGVRSEFTHYMLVTSVGTGRTIGDQYLNVFPNASLSAKLSDETQLYFTMSSRINRAPYARLNPFVLYQDPFTSLQGNPDLQPSVVTSIELGGTHKGWSLKNSYSHAKDPIDGGAFQSEADPRVYILQRTNLSKGHLFATTLSKSINLSWWRSINNASISYDKLIDEAQRFKVGKIRPYFYLYSQNIIDVKDWFTIFATGWYLSNKQDGINNEEDLYSVNLGIEKKLFNKRLVANLDFNDIFHEVRYDGEYTLGFTDIVYANTVNTNYIRFTLAFTFGTQTQRSIKNKNVGEPEGERVGK